ncbi:RND family transporter [Psychrobium sp. 1_MG-2023]|uniref:efflux RND transporter permease subunit n=1 Tax=Psychrobium sp. 1_MG-2023 TaxID=3062624 RepID=UPI000C320643|nr:MMPL family transporter [Psychrobium sp. 1_MG-2023]MDP2560369.1 MMPL family transporter [Psychrobium sp. 1_MG-2023]PKF55479.1 RND transporter [Alteromonadales bacterium alter-6D02]
MNNIVDKIELFIFRQRAFVIAVFAIVTATLLYQATQLKMDAAFSKNIPLQHEYMQTYTKHAKDFGGANSIMVAVRAKQGDIFTPQFFDGLKSVHDQLYFIPGVDRTSVTSLYSPSTRFTEVVEDGFAGGPVIPADFVSDGVGLNIVRGNVEKAGIVGRLVANDYSAAMVTARLMDFNPDTGEPLDTLAFAEQLEEQVRGQFVNEHIDIHIIGFAKMAGDVADGAKGVVQFFLLAIAFTAIMVLLFSRSLILTILPLACSLMAVVWQMGLLTVMGFGLDPMSILVPFLVFAVAVSHSVQVINGVKQKLSGGLSVKDSAAVTFRALLIPGGIALLSDTIGFITLLSIDIGIIRELAISASLGVGVIILTNLVLLPVIISYCNIKISPRDSEDKLAGIWSTLALFASRKVAIVVVIIATGLFAFGHIQSQKIKIGDLDSGAAALHEWSRYNQDTALITERFSITTDVMSVIVEAGADSCTDYDTLALIDKFQWRLNNVEGVQSTISLASVVQTVNGGFNEGNPKWRVLARTQATLVQSVSQIPTTSGLLNTNCSVMPVYLFMSDHKAETIERVVAEVKQQSQLLSTDKVAFKLASGPVGVMAATNEAVEAAQTPMLIYVYGAVILLCLISFRSVKATLSVVIPLFIVSTLAQALMTYLNIGLTVSTLPVIALGVGIGVDYGIYILATMSLYLNQGHTVQQAYLAALKERGTAVIFTGVTLAIGVSTWFFSALKFQMDMGILLTFMFLVNMLGAIIVLPALANLLWYKQGK